MNIQKRVHILVIQVILVLVAYRIVGIILANYSPV